MESLSARKNDTQGYGFQQLAKPYIPYPVPAPQQLILAQKKAGVASIGSYTKTSKLKTQKMVEARCAY
jgi:hypothetical protein